MKVTPELLKQLEALKLRKRLENILSGHGDVLNAPIRIVLRPNTPR